MARSRVPAFVPGILVSVSVALGLLACGMSSEAMFDGDDNPGSRGEGGSVGSEPSPGALGPTSNGIILAHAAAAPAVRLCFGTNLDAAPQPDRKVMPQSNVVGIERGAAVRLPPLGQLQAVLPDGGASPADGGKGDAGARATEVLVLRELEVRQRVGERAVRSCRELVDCDPSQDQGCLSEGTDYVRVQVPELARLATGLHVVSLEGCGPARPDWQGTGRAALGPARCGAGFDPDRGNLSLRVQSVDRAQSRTDRNQLPVQVLHLSQPLQAAGGVVEVSYDVPGAAADGGGDGSAPAPQRIAAPAFGAVAPDRPVAVPLPLDAPSIFGEAAFTVSAGGLRVRQTLAAIQELSDPSTPPTEYWGVGTNYLLLVLGDPGASADAGSETYDGVHVLAVPVADPADLADAGAGPEGGSAPPARDAATGTP